MQKQRCKNCGYELQGCPNCRQQTDKEKPTYSPVGHLMTQFAKRPKRGKINPMPLR